MSEPGAHPRAGEPAERLARLAELRGQHGMARYVDDETLVAWLRPAPADGEREPEPHDGA